MIFEINVKWVTSSIGSTGTVNVNHSQAFNWGKSAEFTQGKKEEITSTMKLP
jgi:hypothetical protein